MVGLPLIERARCLPKEQLRVRSTFPGAILCQAREEGGQHLAPLACERPLRAGRRRARTPPSCLL